MMSEFIEFEAGEEADGYESSIEEEEEIGLSDSEKSDFIDDVGVYVNEDPPPNPYLGDPIRYPRGLDKVINKVCELIRCLFCYIFQKRKREPVIEISSDSESDDAIRISSEDDDDEPKAERPIIFRIDESENETEVFVRDATEYEQMHRRQIKPMRPTKEPRKLPFKFFSQRKGTHYFRKWQIKGTIAMAELML